MGEILSAIFGIEIQATVIVHLARPQDEVKYLDVLQGADVILAQRVAENYPVPFVRTNALRLRYGEKVRIWQNLYFQGYNPDLAYCKRRSPATGRLAGPLGEYHLMAVMSAWRERLGTAGALARLQDLDWYRTNFADASERSLQELQSRERLGGSPVSDLIADQWTRRRLFFTFNHPSAALIAEYAVRVGKDLGLRPVRKIPPQLFGEPLGGLMMPVNPFVQETHQMPFGRSSAYRGAMVRATANDVSFNLSKPTFYTAKELVESFWRVYDAHLRTSDHDF
jgi:hypothetical protein